ncbi:integrin alpha-3b isoform X1 [Erpetoichthys calabaricus]|uniref:integrin alpha-3b isoform X1 n=1 Tax=Erpetoichthys calabaricus TaxID=27687 RepID=UPI0022349B78|nr:integrin alpha-3b isoform X1 [Erpetoichthys calabaricus]
MATSPALLCSCVIVAVLISFFRRADGFNIDLRFPVIKQGQNEGSFFGFSVALHRQTVGDNRYLLLTGAPKEKATSNINANANETGALYYCPITNDMTDCSRVELIQKVSPSTEMIEGMWLGVTVASQGGPTGGRVLACGHRYVRIMMSGNEEQLRMIGKCFVRGNSLNYDEDDDWQIHHYEVCNPGGDLNMEGMCSMGMAAGMTETDVYIGMPGSFNWQGSIDVTWRNPNDGESWDLQERKLSNLDKSNSYIGYSVLDEKNIFYADRYTIISGAPRDEHKGAVYLLDSQNELVSNMTLNGQQVGSYFGNSLAATDLNNDGWKDLIVGAPFYFDRKRELGGAAYIFMNEGGNFQATPTLVLNGVSESGFGFAVANIGDVNQDGFQDIAVGAPFDESGKLFIYHGTNQGLAPEPSQVIDGKDIGTDGIRTFGYSVNGGLDVDENAYPDILVGSLSNKIALLRARPVIQLSKTFTVSPAIVDPAKCTSTSCISVELCFSYILSTGNKDFKKEITLNFRLEADADRRVPRVRFPNTAIPAVYEAQFKMPAMKCVTVDLILSDNIKDKLQPIVFALNYSIPESRPKSRRGAIQNLDAFPVLSDTQKNRDTREISFQKECGNDNKCRSNLQVTASFTTEQQVDLPSKAGRQILQYSPDVKKLYVTVNVTNYPSATKEAEDAHQAILNITLPSALQYSGVRSDKVRCHYEETLLCELGNPFKSLEQATILLIFEASGITLNTQEISAQLQLSTQSEQSDLKPLTIMLLIEYDVQVTFTVDRSVQLTYFSGTVMGESAMKTGQDVGSLVEYTFTVTMNSEPLGDKGTLQLELEWPYEIANGKWLLYLMAISTKGTAATRCVPPGEEVNPLNLTLSKLPSRSKREAEGPAHMESGLTLSASSKGKPTFRLDCSQHTANCIRVHCPLVNMTQEAKVTVRSRVWNSTLLEEFRGASRVTVTAIAKLRLVNSKPTIRMEDKQLQLSLNIDSEIAEEKPYEIELWIIIVAVLAGVLLLGLIILLLWKCGFFKRASYYRIMPKYHAVKIRKEERYQFNEGFLTKNPKKKHWVTNWTEMQRYYY